jgi:hypothetical protein
MRPSESSSELDLTSGNADAGEALGALAIMLRGRDGGRRPRASYE